MSNPWINKTNRWIVEWQITKLMRYHKQVNDKLIDIINGPINKIQFEHWIENKKFVIKEYDRLVFLLKSENPIENHDIDWADYDRFSF